MVNLYRTLTTLAPTAAPTDAPTDTLQTDQSLAHSHSLVSSSGNVQFYVQSDGNMVVYRVDEVVRWESSTSGGVSGYRGSKAETEESSRDYIAEEGSSVGSSSSANSLSVISRIDEDTLHSPLRLNDHYASEKLAK